MKNIDILDVLEILGLHQEKFFENVIYQNNDYYLVVVGCDVLKITNESIELTYDNPEEII